MAGEKTMYNLGINTTLSRKLFHFQPDVKIAQTIEFSAGRGVQWNWSTNNLLSVEGSCHFPRVLFQLQS